MPKLSSSILQPYWQTADKRTVRLYQGDVIAVLRRLPEKSVQTVVTSPPYWALRDYGTDKSLEIGSEKTPEEYVAKIVDVFRGVRRVLRDDGTICLNLGDTYLDSDLVGIPWRVALALQADGWTLRQDIIWHKPSPMPESCKNRCTKAHEYLFLLTKRKYYYYDHYVIREEGEGYGYGTGPAAFRSKRYLNNNALDNNAVPDEASGVHSHSFEGGRNKRSVWSIDDEQRLLSWMASQYPELLDVWLTEMGYKTDVWKIASQGYAGAHFATFPPKLVEPCILAGTSEHGACTKCGAPFKRIVEEQQLIRERPNDYVKRTGEAGTGNSCANSVAGVGVKTLGWQPTCKCSSPKPRPCVVMDPFIGSGTTCDVAIGLGRHSLGIDLSEDYLTNNAIPRVQGALLARPALAWLAGISPEEVQGGDLLYG